VLNFPRSAVQGLYEVGGRGRRRAALSAQAAAGAAGGGVPAGGIPIAASATASNAPGSTKRARRLADAQTRGPIGELVAHGDPKAALKSLREHPVYGGLEAAGAYGAVGRVLGAGARAGLAGARVRAFAQTARPDLELVPGMSRTVKRSYSKNLLTQIGQKTGERSKLRRGLNPQRGASGHDVADHPGAAHSEAAAEANEFGGQVEAERRVGREEIRTRESAHGDQAPAEGRAAGQARAGRGASRRRASAAARSCPRGSRQGPRAAAERVRGRTTPMKPGQRADNRRQVKAIDEAIKAHDAGRFDEAALKAADRIIPATHGHQRGACQQGIETAAAGDGCGGAPYAVEHMGARHETTLAPEQRPSVRPP
jgi:hypothetical protein